MWAPGVVALQVFDDDLSWVCKDFAVEQLVAELRAEAFAISIVPRTIRQDVGRPSTDGRDPTPLRPWLSNSGPLSERISRDAAHGEEIGEHVDDVHETPHPRPRLRSNRDVVRFPHEVLLACSSISKIGRSSCHSSERSRSRGWKPATVAASGPGFRLMAVRDKRRPC